jgi:8-oxo-dGTP pyrophosphatase MutT (NUDIX family)
MSGGWRDRVDGMLRQVAGERGLLWEPLPNGVPGAVVRLADVVEDLAASLSVQGRRWLAATLAVLSEELDDTTGPDERLRPDPVVAVAVVAADAGVVAGRRREGEPAWAFPAATVGPGESPAEAAARACQEQAGLSVRVEREIGRCRRPVTGQQVMYLECTAMNNGWFRAATSQKIVELRWLDRGQVENLIPELPDVVRCFLHLRYILPGSHHC